MNILESTKNRVMKIEYPRKQLFSSPTSPHVLLYGTLRFTATSSTSDTQNNNNSAETPLPGFVLPQGLFFILSSSVFLYLIIRILLDSYLYIYINPFLLHIISLQSRPMARLDLVSELSDRPALYRLGKLIHQNSQVPRLDLSTLESVRSHLIIHLYTHYLYTNNNRYTYIYIYIYTVTHDFFPIFNKRAPWAWLYFLVSLILIYLSYLL